MIENVVPYYDVFIPPSLELDRHLFWTNINVAPLRIERKYGNVAKQSGMGERFGFIIKDKKITVGGNHDMKGQILRNLVNPEIGLAILDQVRVIKRKSKLKQISILD